jgi:hypothetical protein
MVPPGVGAWPRSCAAAKRAGTPADDTLAAYIALYREKHVSTVRAGTAANINRELEHMQDAWPGRSLRSISKKDVVAVIDKAMKRGPSAGDAQNRFIKIAQHYRTLADAEERDAERKGIERRSITSDKLGRAE